jgi:hypothetical protein
VSVRTYSQQKAGLTRALKRCQQYRCGKPDEDRELARGARAKLVDEVRRTIAEWESPEWSARYGVRQGAWPDDWARWQRAIDEVFPVFQGPALRALG